MPDTVHKLRRVCQIEVSVYIYVTCACSSIMCEMFIGVTRCVVGIEDLTLRSRKYVHSTHQEWVRVHNNCEHLRNEVEGNAVLVRSGVRMCRVTLFERHDAAV